MRIPVQILLFSPEKSNFDEKTFLEYLNGTLMLLNHNEQESL